MNCSLEWQHHCVDYEAKIEMKLPIVKIAFALAFQLLADFHISQTATSERD
jgi:hypothetical protein